MHSSAHRERERERAYIYIYMYVCVYVIVYTYIRGERERERARQNLTCHPAVCLQQPTLNLSPNDLHKPKVLHQTLQRAGRGRDKGDMLSRQVCVSLFPCTGYRYLDP